MGKIIHDTLLCQQSSVQLCWGKNCSKVTIHTCWRNTRSWRLRHLQKQKWRNRKLFRWFKRKNFAVKFLPHVIEILIIDRHQLMKIVTRCLWKKKKLKKELNKKSYLHFSWLDNKTLLSEFLPASSWRALTREFVFRLYFLPQDISGYFPRHFCSFGSRVRHVCRCWRCREVSRSFFSRADLKAWETYRDDPACCERMLFQFCRLGRSFDLISVRKCWCLFLRLIWSKILLKFYKNSKKNLPIIDIANLYSCDSVEGISLV